jgi:hypothetical protein
VDTKLDTIATAGKVSDSALSSNAALLDRANQTFTAVNKFTQATSGIEATGASIKTIRGFGADGVRFSSATTFASSATFASTIQSGIIGVGVAPATYGLHVLSAGAVGLRTIRVAFDGSYYMEMKQNGASGNIINSNNTSFILQSNGVDAYHVEASGNLVMQAGTGGGVIQLHNGTTVVDGGIKFDRTNEDLSIGDGSASQIVHMGAWKTWTPTYGGFSVAPTPVTAAYTQVGKMVTARIRKNPASPGTSNATTCTVTLPVAAKEDAHVSWMRYVDNGVSPATPGMLVTRGGSTTLDLYTGFNGAGWTASGDKDVEFVFTYEAQ